MSEEETITLEEIFSKLTKKDLTRKLSYLAIAFSALIGTYLRIEMGYLDRLIALDPFEMYHLSEHWLNHWAPATVDKLLFPGPGGSLSGVGYPPLTHALPAVLTKFFNLLGLQLSLKTIVIVLPVFLGALLPVVYWFVGKELYNEKVGIVAALLTFVFPQLIVIGTAGKYDTNIYIALFLPLILGLFVKSFNQTKVLEKTKWGLFAGTAMGLFGLFWAGYTLVFALTAFSIILYTAVASWIDKIEKEDTYSLLGILISYPILSFFHTFDLTQGVLFVAPLVFLPYIAAELPEWSKKLSFVEDGKKFRKTIVSLFTVAILITSYLVYVGILDINVRGIGMVKQTAIIQSTISELQSTYARGLQPLASNFGALGNLVLPVLFLPQLLIIYKLYKKFNPARFFELVFVGFTFLMHFFASRFLSLYLFTVTFAIAAELVWTIDYIGGAKKIRKSFEKTYVDLDSWDKFKALIVFGAIIWILFASLPVAGLPLTKDFKVQQQPSVVYSESRGAWINTFNYLDNNESVTTEDHVLSWWDYGFAMKVLGNVGVFTDNTQFNAEEAAKFYVMQNLTQGRQYLVENMQEERNETVDYVIGNKYIGYSGKWHAVVTVSSGLMDTPNLADGINPGEYEWAWGRNQVGNKTKHSNYYKLSFYNASKYGVGDEPYPGYKIAYQSPQWYIQYYPQGSQQPSLAIVNASTALSGLFPSDQVLGPAITLYELNQTQTTQ